MTTTKKSLVSKSHNTTGPGILTHAVSLEYPNKQKNVYYQNFDQFLEFIKPIQITDEILKKINIPFKIIKHHKHDDIYVMFFGQETILMNYLHELQNIIFILTNEELTFIE